MRIQVWDYLEEYSELKGEILAAVDRVFSSGRLILGEDLKRFEQAFAGYCDASHGVGVNSGTDALFIALKALGIDNGDEVITVPNTAVPTVSAIVSTGAKPVFVDVDEGTCLMRVDQVEARIGPRTKCILPVHLYGQCVDMATLTAIADKHGLKVLEDCAQSAGTTQAGRKSGALGHVSAHSFYPTKNLGAYGDAGMIVTADAALAERARDLRMYGMRGTYYAETHGYNSRLDEVQAAILNIKLGHLDRWVARRRAIAERYNAALAGTALKLPVEAPDNVHSYYVYVVRHPERDRLLSVLKAQDIHCNISYPFPIHTMRAYAWLGGREGDYPAAERLATEVFSLPMYPTLSDEKVERVIDVLRNAVT